MPPLPATTEPEAGTGFLSRSPAAEGWREKAEAVLLKVADGTPLHKAVTEVGIARTTFYLWMLRERGIAESWRVARRLQAQALFDKGLGAVEELHDGEWKKDDTNKVRALDAAARWWLFAAARLNPSDFGEQQAKTPPVTVVIETSLGAKVDGQAITPTTYTLTVTPPPDETDETRNGVAPGARPGQRGPAGRRGMGGTNVLTSPDMGPRATPIDNP